MVLSQATYLIRLGLYSCCMFPEDDHSNPFKTWPVDFDGLRSGRLDQPDFLGERSDDELQVYQHTWATVLRYNSGGK